ncbi:MAG: FAD-binding oxidoreductase [Cellvibrionaceae bacterium]
MNEDILAPLKSIVGNNGYREGDHIDQKNYKDIMGARKIRPRILLRPTTTDQVSHILAYCNENKLPITPQGGMTGLVSAAAPMEQEIAISLERMNDIIEIDTYSSSMTVEAGVLLQTIQEAADDQQLLFPLDLGARGSCTIGGNLSTNAGGNRVIRYGMARELVIGVEAVLADGTIINELHKLRKNNSGYELKQLFIGSEGTLGIITRATLKLFPKPSTQTVAFCAATDFTQVSKLLVHMQASLGGNLTAFEVIWNNTYKLIEEHIDYVQLPMPSEHNFYVLIESMGTSEESDKELFENALEAAINDELIVDAVLSQSEKEMTGIWAIRDSAADISRGVGLTHSYDVSMSINDMSYFGEEVEKRLRNEWPEAIIAIFGHVGDGNLHVLVRTGDNNREMHDAVDEIIYTLIRELNGAVSAEHGIGITKKKYLSYSRSPEEITLMKTMKQALDPNGILSQGRVF